MDLTFRGTEPDLPEQAERPPAGPQSRPDSAVPRAPHARWRTAAVVVIAVGVAIRFVAFSHLWLDEALSVNIARLPLADIPEALRRDGAPPTYYVLLHGWMKVFGTGTAAVRALSGLFSVAALPLVWLAARRLASGTALGAAAGTAPGTRSGTAYWPAAGGVNRLAWTAAVLMAASPFAVRYATEARMYSLVVVLVLAGFLALGAVLDGGGARPAVILAVLTGLSLLTHYWCFYLLAVTMVSLAYLVLRRPDAAPRGARRALLALGGGVVLFLPWAPSFLFQLRNTGTPWGNPGEIRSVFDTVTHFAGGYWDAGIPLGLAYFALVGLALFGSAVDGRRVLLDLRPHPPARGLAIIAFGTLVVAIVAGRIGGSAFAVRYAAVLFPLLILLVALGTEAFSDHRVHHRVVAVMVVLGLWGCVPNLVGERTSAVRVAAALETRAQPGDVVAYCPDQLGPSVSRELQADGLVQLTFPRAAPPERVDWVRYAEVNKAARTADFAQLLLDRAGPDHTVWVVWAPGYRTFGTKCQLLIERLERARPDTQRVVKISTRYFERPGLVRFGPPTQN